MRKADKKSLKENEVQEDMSDLNENIIEQSNDAVDLQEGDLSVDKQDSSLANDEGNDGDDTRNWYIAQTKSNYEFKVEKRVQSLIEEKRFEGKLFKVLVPMQQTVELKNNKRSEKNTKIFPGYVFIQMVFEDELAYADSSYLVYQNLLGWVISLLLLLKKIFYVCCVKLGIRQKR